MRVLIVTLDLYRTVGGGEMVYRRLIEANPHIDFVYFRREEPAHARRPANARSVEFRLERDVVSPGESSPRLENLRIANAYSRGVAGQTFDVVELPDYMTFGAFLRDCLRYHRVTFKALVMAMHGNISRAIEAGWEPNPHTVLHDRQLEEQQFLDVDARYAISERYMAEWQARFPVDIHCLDPLAIVGGPALAQWSGQHAKPDLYCIGRMSRIKGNDLFVEIVRWLDPGVFGKSFHVGTGEVLSRGGSSQQLLAAIAAARNVGIEFMPAQDRNGLDAIRRRNSMIVLPVRYDFFNLVALETVLSGCPAAVSSGAGVCDYLDRHLPEIPYVKLPLTDFYGGIDKLQTFLEDYVAHRSRLIAAVKGLRAGPSSLDMGDFYKEAVRRASMLGRSARHRDYREVPRNVGGRIYEVARKLAPQPVLNVAKAIIRSPRSTFSRQLRKLGLFGDAKVLWHMARSREYQHRLYRTLLLPERKAEDIDAKVRALQALGDTPIFRCNVWRELARLERTRGNELVAISYDLRNMRLLGAHASINPADIIASLERNGFPDVAAACKALYEPGTEPQADLVLNYLAGRYESCLHDAALPWEHLDDRRSGKARVAIIVSLYNAASKLRHFLSAISLQTMVRRGEVEVILVDSGSPDAERATLSAYLSTTPLNVVYARSPKRETIQAAWNRGIHLARAPYLVFLGVDETLYPETLDRLATELDSDPRLDWVMANSLITETDEKGVFARDVMMYDRNGATKDYTYLETCYLSWVGGMYRRSVHERFGYYDSTFRASGDTEFKNRILPHIRVKFVPETLGVFMNYPENRTTASPLAEIEDTRAWYIHRTLGGVRYGFGNRNLDDAVSLFYAALGYRKSYCRHRSSDIEYGTALLEYLKEKGATGSVLRLEGDLRRLLGDLKKVEWTSESVGHSWAGKHVAKAWWSATMLQRKHARLAPPTATPEYKVFNDNRYEQHFWLWNAV